MVINFSPDVAVTISRMDKHFNSDMSAMNLNIYSDTGFDIDPIVELCKENGNKFNFVCGDDELDGYKLVSASEYYDAVSKTRTATLNFDKRID